MQIDLNLPQLISLSAGVITEWAAHGPTPRGVIGAIIAGWNGALYGGLATDSSEGIHVSQDRGETAQGLLRLIGTSFAINVVAGAIIHLFAVHLSLWTANIALTGLGLLGGKFLSKEPLEGIKYYVNGIAINTCNICLCTGVATTLMTLGKLFRTYTIASAASFGVGFMGTSAVVVVGSIVGYYAERREEAT